MSKKHWYKIVIAGVILVCAIFWVLNAAGLEAFAGFDGYIAVALISGISGLLLVVRGLFIKGNTVQKKGSIFFGAGLLILAVAAVALKFSFQDEKWFVPVIIAVAAAALFLSYVAVGAKKWDTGENQKVGYKNYYERKKDEEEAARKKKENED